MPIIRIDQLGHKERHHPDGAIPRQTVTVFQTARLRPAGQQTGEVIKQIREMFEAGTLRLTAILNEAEPYRTMALECLTGWNGSTRVSPYRYQMSTVRLKHRGPSGVDAEGKPLAPPIKVVTDRVPVSNSLRGADCDTRTDSGVRHMRFYADWMPQQEIELPFEQAIGMLHKHGWWVMPHLSGRIRRKYRLIAELDKDGNEVDYQGKVPEQPGRGEEHVITRAEEDARNEEARGGGSIPEHITKRVRNQHGAVE